MRETERLYAMMKTVCVDAPQDEDDDQTDDYGHRIKSRDEIEEDRADSIRARQRDDDDRYREGRE